MMRIKKNDTVAVISGKDKGKRGIVLEILPKKGKVKVRGVMIITHHVKARRSGETGSIRKEEAFIDISNVMPISPSSDVPTRVRYTTQENGNKSRVSQRSGESF